MHEFAIEIAAASQSANCSGGLEGRVLLPQRVFQDVFGDNQNPERARLNLALRRTNITKLQVHPGLRMHFKRRNFQQQGDDASPVD